MKLAASMTDAIGGTPVVKLGAVVPRGAADVYVKLEWFNPTGSYKDRMALAMIEEAEQRGALQPGMTVVEYTGGSTGSSLAFVCAAKGYHFVAVSSDAFAPAKLRTMRALGADLTIEPSSDGRVTPDLVERMVARAAELADRPSTYFTDQLRNADQLVGYAGIGRELTEQIIGPIDVFCAAVGTAGLAMGVSRALADAGSHAALVIFEPEASAPISGGRPGAHHVEGIGIGFLPPLLDLACCHEVRTVSEADGRVMARRLAREEGLLTGTSSGLNVAGAVAIAEELGAGHTVITVAVDTGLKYLDGTLFDTGPDGQL